MQITERGCEPGQSEYPNGEEQTGKREYQHRRRSKPSPTVWRITLTIGDNLMIIISTILALPFIERLKMNLPLSVSWKELFLICLLVVSWNIASNVTQACDLVNASSRWRSALCVLLSFTLISITWAVLSSLFPIESQAVLIEVLTRFVAIAFAILNLWRVAFATSINLPFFRYQSVILGVTKTGEIIAEDLRNGVGVGLNILGFIDDSYINQQLHSGLPILGGREVLGRLARNGVIDTIIMALDYRANSALFQEALDAAQLGVAVLPITAIYERKVGKLPVEHIGDQWYLSLPSERVISPYYLCWQKVLEILFGLIGLAVLLLTMVFLAPLIYIDSPGPIFYTQERIGYQGRKFRIYKFRSMHTKAETEGKVQWTKKRDTRITRLGTVLRATHLDELPQVLNILLGDMTLIGPRPERPAFVSNLEKSIPFYRCRLSVKPGLTGWAQVKYHYGNTDQDALVKLQYDLYYIKLRSFMLDVLILLKTVVEVVCLRGY